MAWMLLGFARLPAAVRPPWVLAHPAGDALVVEIDPAALAASDAPTPEEADRLVGHAVAHEQALSVAMGHGPVLPVRFGAVFSSPDAVRALMDRNAGRIAAFLDGPGACEEWSLKGRLDAAAARAWLDAHDPELARLRAAAPSTPGAKYFYEKKLKAAADARLAAWVGEVAERARAALVPPAEDARPLTASRAQSAEDARPLAVYQAYLVPPAAREEWRAKVGELAAACGPAGLELAAVGPWPPFSFAPELDGAG